jgi:polyisoprenoid-binding protein YceI
MKKHFVFSVAAFAAVAVLSSCGNSGQQAEETPQKVTLSMEADPAVSTVAWSGTMVGVYTHTGTVALTSGTFVVEDGVVVSGEFSADLTNMAATDENYNVEEGSTPDKLIGHLQSADFFDVENHPSAKFVVTGNDGGAVKGNLTVRGVTNEEVLQDVVVNAETGEASAKLNFDRQKYGVAWKHWLQDMVLEDEIKLTINLKAKSQS